MALFDSGHIKYYLVVFALIGISAYMGDKWKSAFEPNDEYELIRKYLLNDSVLYGYNKPKIWIHTKFEYNARRWKSFQSRSTTDLNVPYIHLTIRTIINHCGDDFHICLIDDDTFSKLIPTWDIDLKTVAEPMKEHYREIAMAELIYYYGGMVLPNSLLCLKNLDKLYYRGTEGDRPFICEGVNRSCNTLKQQNRMAFTPNTYIYGARKNNEVIKSYIEYLKLRSQNAHFSSENEFLGTNSQWFLDAINQQKVNLIGGEVVGVKTNRRKGILLEDLMGEDYLDLSPSCLAIYIPNDEILQRVHYQWFASLRSEDVIETDPIITKYLKSSMIDIGEKYYDNKSKEMKTVISI